MIFILFSKKKSATGCLVLMLASKVFAALPAAGERTNAAAFLPLISIDWLDTRSELMAIDLSVTSVNETQNRQSGMQYTVGLDYFRVISSSTRDLATINLQPYLAVIRDYPAPVPGFYDAPNDWKFIPKINTINFHLTADRSLNLKVGHLELPYGLEATINNAGELRQFTRAANTGMNADWGVTLNGTLSPIQYEFGVSRGSGLYYDTQFDPYAIFGRVGTPVDWEGYAGIPEAGLSFFRGRVLSPNGATYTDRWRVAADGQYHFGLLGILTEFSGGQDTSFKGVKSDVANGLLELDLALLHEALTLYGQGSLYFTRKAGSDWTDKGVVEFGVRWAISSRWTASCQYNEILWRPAGTPDVGYLNAQLRFRF